jgi:hypothetical protein
MRTAVIYNLSVRRIMVNTDDSTDRVRLNIAERLANEVNGSLNREIAVRLPRRLDFDGWRLRTSRELAALTY